MIIPQIYIKRNDCSNNIFFLMRNKLLLGYKIEVDNVDNIECNPTVLRNDKTK
jgi:hypothetical protein